MRHFFAVITASLLLLAGCAPAGTPAAAEIEQWRAEQDRLDERLDAIEAALDTALDTLGGPDPATLAELHRRVGDALDTLEAIEAELAADREARLAFSEQVGELESDLRGSIEQLRDVVQAMNAQIEDLQVRYEVLQLRIDRLN